MQIRTHDTKTGKVFEFIRWEYDAERMRGKSTTLGRMNAAWAEAPAPVLAKMSKGEREEYMQFQKARQEAERLHRVTKTPDYAVEYLTACLERFRLHKDEKSEAQAIAIGSAVARLYAVFREAGYEVPWPERAPRQIDLEEAIAAVAAKEAAAPETGRGRKKQG